MLGEDHSLEHDFPEHKEAIARLVKADEQFARDAVQYNALDKEIRNLELNGAPISDEEMHQKKHDRAVLKDALYERLLEAGSA